MRGEVSWTTVLFMLASTVLLSQTVLSQDTEEANLNPDDFDTSVSPEAKRAWKQFQGSWGKRDGDDLNEVKREWKQLQGSWGKRPDSIGWPYGDTDAESMAKRAWSNLHGTWGKRDEIHPVILRAIMRNILESSPESMDAKPFKRSWAQFNGSWGKRPHSTRSMSPRSTNWSSLRGSWGKRNDWTQLRGGWGKRNDEN